MKKCELVDAVSDDCGHPRTVVRAVLDATTRAVTDALRRGDSVRLIGLGKLRVTARPPKKARNIHTGESVMVPARKVPVFKASETLESEVQ